jgi:hypothetical protein
MELTGALSNPFQSHKDLLMRLSKMRRAHPPTRITSAQQPFPARAGDIKRTVIRAVADTPLSLREIHSRCERLLGRPVSYATVEDCVHKHARGRGPISNAPATGSTGIAAKA